MRRNLQVNATHCLKCDFDFNAAITQKPLVIDLVHQGESIQQALSKLEQAINACFWNHQPALKVIHGYGSSGHSARIMPHIVNALQKYARQYHGTVRPDGENPGAHWLIFNETKFSLNKGSRF